MKEVKPIIPIVYENNKPMTGIIDMARIHNESKLVKKAVAEALSARDKEWEEKIKVIHSNIQKRLENGGSPIVVLATVKADIDSLLSQMKEGK